jgi:hypothetical protein
MNSNDQSSWTKSVIQVAAAGFGAAVAGPLGGALGGFLGAAFSGPTSALIESYSKQFGEESVKKMLDIGADSLALELKQSSPSIEGIYRIALRESLIEIHRESKSDDYRDWFEDWDLCLTMADKLDFPPISPAERVPSKFDEALVSTLEFLDAQGAAMGSHMTLVSLAVRALPESLLRMLKEKLPQQLLSRFRDLIVRPEFDQVWKQQELAFQDVIANTFDEITNALKGIGANTDLLPAMAQDTAAIRKLLETPVPKSTNPLGELTDRDVVRDMLSRCYRRALFTRLPAQQDYEAMFKSIAACHEVVRSATSKLLQDDLQGLAMDLGVTLDRMLARNIPLSDEQLNVLKIQALKLFRELGNRVGVVYPLPQAGSLASAAYFTQDEADNPPSADDILNALRISPTGTAVFDR